MPHSPRQAASSSRASKALPPFLQHILDILDEAAPEVASWSRLGDSFIVSDVKRFSDEHLAAHFKSAQFNSFVRQLNFYGFHKISCDNKITWEFKHECFIRGRLDLIRTIKRRTSADYHTAGKGEVADLRQRVGVLEGELKHSQANFAALAEFISRMHGSEAVSRMAVPAYVAEALAAAGMAVNTSRDGRWEASSSSSVAAPAAPAVEEPARVVAEKRQHRRAHSGGGDSPLSVEDLEILEDTDFAVAHEDVKPTGRVNVPGAQLAKRRRVEPVAGAEAEDISAEDAVVAPMDDADLELLAQMDAPTGKGVSIVVPEDVEDISSAFTASLDFTGAGAVAGPASPEEAWGWADKASAVPSSMTSAHSASFFVPTSANPAGGPPTPTGSQTVGGAAGSVDAPVSPATGISTAALFVELAARVVSSMEFAKAGEGR